MKIPNKYLPCYNVVRTVIARPSQILSVSFTINTVHITIDGGATVSFITLEKAKSLQMVIHKTSQDAIQLKLMVFLNL